MNAFDDRKALHKKALRRRWEQMEAIKERLRLEGPWVQELQRHNQEQWKWRPKARGLGPLAAQAFGDHGALARLLLILLAGDPADAHVRSENGARHLFLRRMGHMESLGVFAQGDELFEQVAKASSVKNWPWETWPQSATIEATAGRWRFSLMLLSTPTSPQGFELIIRCLASPVFTPRQERQSERWEKRRLEIMDQAKAEREARRALLDNEFKASSPQGPSQELLRACSEGRFAMVSKLLSEGADPNAQLWRGKTPFTVELVFPLKLAANAEGKGKAAAIAALLKAGAGPDLLDQSGWTALMRAAHAGKRSAVEALLPASLVDAQDFNGESALIMAAGRESAQCVKILAANASVDLPCFGFHGAGPDGEPKRIDRSATALANAAAFDEAEACEALLAAGADPRVKNDAQALWEKDWGDARVKELLNCAARRLDEKEQIEQASARAAGSKPASRL